MPEGGEFIFKFMSNLAKGADASEKVTLGVMGLVGLGFVYPTQYNPYLFIIFILFAGIHLSNIYFKPNLPHVINEPERLCPHCDVPLKPVKFFCPRCKREI